MKIYFFQFNAVIIFTTVIISCKNVAKYSMDNKPAIKIDTNLCGIWKVVEDTDKADYILVQNYDDVLYVPSNKEKRPNEGDLNYTDYQEKKDYFYYVTRMDSHGRNPHYQQWGAFLSKLNGIKFLNIAYFYGIKSGYIFAKILEVNNTHNRITVAVIADTTLKDLNSSKDVSSRIKKNINNSTFYSDTIHFYKVSSFHSSLHGSVAIANPKH